MKITSKPARHTTSSFIDREAINRLELILNHQRLVAPNLKRDDTWPNHDGCLEVLNNIDGDVEGIIFVQVKTLNQKNMGQRISYSFKDDKFFAFCSRDHANPILFIGVDSKNNVAYWQEMTSQYITDLNSRTIYLDNQNIIAIDNIGYHAYWLKLCEEHKKAIKNYRERKDVEERSQEVKPPGKKVQVPHYIVDKAKHKLQTLFIDITLKYKYFYAFVELLEPFYLDKKGEEQRKKLRGLFEIKKDEEQKFIKDMADNGLIKIVGDLCIINDQKKAIELQKEMIEKGAIDIEIILKLFA